MKVATRRTRQRFPKILNAALAALLLTPLGTGCSYLFVDGPSSYNARKTGVCTDDYILPTVDVVMSAMQVGGIILTASQDEMPDDGGARQARIVGSILGLALWGSSAIVGSMWVSDCRMSQAVDTRPRLRNVTRSQRKAEEAEEEAAAQQRRRQQQVEQAQQAAAAKAAGEAAQRAQSPDGGPSEPSEP